ncbi:PREDICTED: perilipin-3 isoform X3 [Ficedula albicollis]|uniref:perilipin-3 isoform X3 n=1 Tax=Ficedula albicollis TaxID=59894 RepID=UPI0007AD7C54|nr:PREDICTED: perilipin-3 isoform X3 [Ficedula albicollis]
MASGKTPTPALLKAEEQQTASAVDRVTSLPLLSSAFNLVSSAYSHTKESHPCLGGVCSVAETVAAVAVGSVLGGAQPILSQLEPQIALVNEYACKGLDQLEENLPFLQQPADKVISDTKQLVTSKVTSAMDAACEAKEAVADKVTEAVDLTKNVVGDSVKLTRSVVTSTVSSAVEAAQGAKELVTNKVTEAVDVTKHMVEDSVDLTKSAVASTIVSAVEAAQGAKEMVTDKVTKAVDLSKHMVEDSVDLTKSAVASTIVNAVEAAQGAKELVTNKVTEAVDVTKHMVEDSVDRTKSAVASTIVNAVEAAQGAKELVTNKVTEAVDVTKHMVEDSVDRTKSAVASTITAAVGAAQGAKELVANKVTEAVDLTKGAVQDSVEKTKSVVTSTVSTALDAAYGTITSKINTALEQGREALQEGVEMTNSVVANSISKAKAVSQAVAGGVESVLGMSEDLVDHYLPMTEEELGKLATTVQGFGVASLEEQRRQRSYFVRLGSLSGRLRHRAHQHSLARLQSLRHSTQDTLARLQLAIQLIESVKQEVGQKLLEGQEKLHQLWVDWSLTQPKGNQVRTACQPEQVEPRTLAMLRIITQQLQPAYESLRLRTHGLPCSIQDAVSQATRHIHKLHSSFSRAVSFQDLSGTTLARCQDRVAEARRSLDVLLEYVTHNTPLNWVVGPFRAMAKGAQESRKQEKKEMRSDRKLEKAPLSQEVTKAPEEPKGANRLSEKWCEVLDKLEEQVGKPEEKERKDTEVALAAKAIETSAPEEDL